MHDGYQVDLCLRSFEERDLNKPAFKRQRVNIPGEVVTANHVQNDIDSSASRQVVDDLNKIFGAIADGPLGAESLARVAFLG